MSDAFQNFRHTTYKTHLSDFITHFTKKEIQKEEENKKKPKPLTKQDRAVFQAELELKLPAAPPPASNTRINISIFLPKWKR